MVKKEVNKKDSSVSERHFGVILEDINSKLDSVVEGNQALDVKFSKKFDEVDEKLKDIDGKIDIHTEILNSHTEMIGSTAIDVETLKGMTAKNTENIEIIKSDIEFIKNSLKKKVDIDEFAFLEKRVVLLERKLQRI